MLRGPGAHLSRTPMHWFCREDCVVVKFTKVTREQRSGVKTAVGSRVTSTWLEKVEEIDVSPRVCKTS